jgi:hypothetical protein
MVWQPTDVITIQFQAEQLQRALGFLGERAYKDVWDIIATANAQAAQQQQQRESRALGNGQDATINLPQPPSS